MIFKTVMIRDPNNPVSVAYADYCYRSWRGFNLKFYNAVTPDTLDKNKGINFQNKTNGKEHSDTEKACFYSQYNLWKRCALENIPYLILEHDAFLEKPYDIHYSPALMVQFLGQHAMEAVMYHPKFCRELVTQAGKINVRFGPMSFVDSMLGYFNRNEQSRYGIPHSRCQGRYAPVKSVIDPNLGNTINHDSNIKERLKKDADLFLTVDLASLGLYKP